MQCANNFPCDWVITGIHKNNDKEVKSRRFYMPEEWSTWVSWVKSQLWCAALSIVVLTELNCFLFYIVEVVLYVFSVLLAAVRMKYGNIIFLLFENSRHIICEQMKMINDMCRHRIKTVLVRSFGSFCKGTYPNVMVLVNSSVPPPDFSYVTGELIL